MRALTISLVLLLSLLTADSSCSGVVSRKKGSVKTAHSNRGDLLLSTTITKKKKKHAAASDDDAPPADAAPAAGPGAPSSSGPSNGNSTAPAAVAAAPAAPVKKSLEVTPCVVANFPCNQPVQGVVMPGQVQEGVFVPGQNLNGVFIRGQTIDGKFFPTPKSGPDPKVEEAKKKLADETARLVKESADQKAKIEREDKLRKERDEKEEKERKQRLEAMEKEEKAAKEKNEKEEHDRKRQREREEEDYLRQKEARELEERRLQHQKERDERLEEEHKKELKEEKAREEEFERKSVELHKRIDDLQAKTSKEAAAMKAEILAKAHDEVVRALNHKRAAHILGENAQKKGFVEGAYEGIIDTKKAADFGKDVSEKVTQAVKEAEAQAFARGQIEELAKARAKLEAHERIEEAFKAGVAAASKRAAEEEAERNRDRQLVAKNATAGANEVVSGDGKVLAKGTLAHPSWSYNGALGPQHWGGVCQTGPLQSPVNIYGIARDVVAGEAELKPLDFSYVPSGLKLEFSDRVIKMLYDRGSTFTLGGVVYDLKRVEFKTPSEHKVRGLRFPMEIQLHHAGQNNPNLKSIVSLLVTEGPESAALALFWPALPKLEGDVVTAEGGGFNAADLLPLSHAYFSYEGSETRPPCTEGVAWVVLSHYITASPAQIQRIEAITGLNSRGVQVGNGRRIRQYSPEDVEKKAREEEVAREHELKNSNQ